MHSSRIVHAGLALVAVALVLLGGCRSTSTDRMRVLEAEKAEAERKAGELTHEKAAWRSKEIELEARAKSETARADALQEQVDLLRDNMNRGERKPDATIDTEALRDRLKGAGVDLKEGKDGPTIILASDVTFRAGRADLSNKAQSSLKQVALALKETAGIAAVRVEGHTDSDPIRKSGWKSNEALSLARAEMVRNYLVRSGVSKMFLEVKGYGASDPVATNKTDAGKAQNRRVEIVVLQH